MSDNIKDEIKKELSEKQDLKYRDMQIKIIPSVDADSIIGVRTPELRSMAKRLSKNEDIRVFLDDLPHRYFDENQLHAFIISEIKDYETCVKEVERFLPYKVFKKHKEDLLKKIKTWMSSSEPYSIRFGIEMLMSHYLEEDFDIEYPDMVATVRSDEYYVNMMIAWYFATALAKQYDKKKLDVWTHNKAIQKAVESNRISPEQKDYLKTLKIKKEK